MRRILATIGLLLLTLGVIGRATPLATPEGRQCPTAPIQTVRVAVLSACGCVIGHVERTLRPGDKGFVQCRCSEKRTAQESSIPPMPALAPMGVVLRLPVAPPEATDHRYVLVHADRALPTADRPPTIS